MRHALLRASVRHAISAGIAFLCLAFPASAQSGPPDAEARRATLVTLDWLNTGRTAEVHALMTPELQAMVTPDALAATWAEIGAQMGQAERGGVASITWYPDPERSGQLGAVDFGLRYPTDHLICGYVLWAVGGPGTRPRIARIETTTLPPEMVTASPERFLDLFQETSCRAIPGGLTGPKE